MSNHDLTPRSGIKKFCNIEHGKSFWIARQISWNNFEIFFASDGVVVCDQQTKKSLIPSHKQTNKQTNKQTITTITTAAKP